MVTVRSREPQVDSRPEIANTVGGRSVIWACGFARRSGRRISSRSFVGEQSAFEYQGGDAAAVGQSLAGN